MTTGGLAKESDNMVKYSFIAYAGLAVALPLNINLGAYSPALVVGTVPLLTLPPSLADKITYKANR